MPNREWKRDEWNNSPFILSNWLARITAIIVAFINCCVLKPFVECKTEILSIFLYAYFICAFITFILVLQFYTYLDTSFLFCSSIINCKYCGKFVISYCHNYFKVFDLLLLSHRKRSSAALFFFFASCDPLSSFQPICN